MPSSLKATRQVANDFRPDQSAAALAPRVIPTITLRYKPKKQSRALQVVATLLLCGITGYVSWYANKAVTLIVAAKAIFDEMTVPSEAPAAEINAPVDLVLPAPPPDEEPVAEEPALPDLLPMTPIPPQMTRAPANMLMTPAPEQMVEIPMPEPAVAIEDKPADIILPVEKSIEPPAFSASAGYSRQANYAADTAPDENQLLEDARAQVAANDISAALKIYSDILRNDGSNHAALSGKAFALARAKQYEGAVTTLQRLLKIYPRDDAARLNLVVALGQWQSPKAITELKKMVAANPDNATAHMALGKQLERRGDFPNAIVQLDTAAHQAPNDLSYRLDLAILYDHAGYVPQALTLYQQILQAANGPGMMSLPIPAENIQQRIDYLDAKDKAGGAR